jgi:competence protein ComEA
MDDMSSLGMSRQQTLIVGIVLLAVLALAGTRLAHSGTAREAPPAARASVRAVPARGAALVVDVAGAVRRPGLYRLRPGARVADAVTRAGGPTRLALLSAVNLAAPLVDGTQVLVPARVGDVTQAAGAGQGAAGAGAAKVSLSSATAAQLDALPGIGPVTAEKIVDWRSAHGAFASVDALDAIPGIGPARIEQLRELVTP